MSLFEESPNRSPERWNQVMSRRRALKVLGAGAGLLVAGGLAGGYGYRRSLRLPSADARRVRKARIVIAGGSIGGLTVAARLMRGVPDANVTVIEPRTTHHYQPGYTLVGAGVYGLDDVLFDQESLHPLGLRWVGDRVTAFEPDRNRLITGAGERIEYDYLVVALGVETDFESVEGFAEAMESPHAANIYNLESSRKFRELARAFTHGKAVFTFPRGYVKCGGAPQKITWLSEDLWRSAGHRENIDVHFHTAQHSLFPAVPAIDAVVTPMMEARGLNNHYKQVLRAIDVSTRTAIFEEEKEDGTAREIRRRYDLLHPMPSFRTPRALRHSPLTSEGLGGQAEVDRYTLRHPRFANVFGVGDCAATGAAKTAATIRKQAPVIVQNIFDAVLDDEPSGRYDGASGCPLLTRYGRCMMFEFDYDGELINEWLYRPTTETRRWWHFKVHGLKRLYRHVMIGGWV